jgi:hypothetical protein
MQNIFHYIYSGLHYCSTSRSTAQTIAAIENANWKIQGKNPQKNAE